MEKRSAKRFLMFFIICGLCGVFRFRAQAAEFDYSPISELPQGADAGDYIKLSAEGSTYEVEPGDSLWEIAAKLWGDGNRYPELVGANNGLLSDPDHIEPGEKLAIPKVLYIPGGDAAEGAYEEGAYRIRFADGDYSSGRMNYFARVTHPDDGIYVNWSVVTNQMGHNALTDDWDDFVREVKRCSGEVCGGRVFDLTFEKYQMADGCDLCGYTFLLDTGENIEKIAVFYRLGTQNMAEIIGVCDNEKNPAMADVVRCIAASFEDLGGKLKTGAAMWDDIRGGEEWKYPELHNIFVDAMEGYGLPGGGKPERDTTGDHALTWEEPLIEQAVRSALVDLWEMDEAEQAAFMDRPVMASDVAVITRLTCRKYNWTYHTLPPRDVTIIAFRFNHHEEEIELERGGSISFADLANFSAVEQLELYKIPDDECFSAMPHLRKLDITVAQLGADLDFLKYCKELRALYVRGGGFSQLTEIPELADCRELKYLYLETPRLTDFTFLKACTQVRTFEIAGELSSWAQAAPYEERIPGLELLPNAQFIVFYDNTVRCEP